MDGERNSLTGSMSDSDSFLSKSDSEFYSIGQFVSGPGIGILESSDPSDSGASD